MELVYLIVYMKITFFCLLKDQINILMTYLMKIEIHMKYAIKTNMISIYGFRDRDRLLCSIYCCLDKPNFPTKQFEFNYFVQIFRFLDLFSTKLSYYFEFQIGFGS